MQTLMRLLAWRSRQRASLRWIEAIGLVLAAVLLRAALGPLAGINPGATFFPVLLLVTILLGWKEGLLVLFVLTAVGAWFFNPPHMYLAPIAWLLVGGFVIALIGVLRATAQQLEAANERQKMLLQVARQRMATARQSSMDLPDLANPRLTPARAEAARIMADAARRIAGAGDAPTHTAQELTSILQDAIETAIDTKGVHLAVDVEPLELSFDQMSSLTMLVIELATLAQKHIFRPGAGAAFRIGLRAGPPGHATLTATDPGVPADSAELVVVHGLLDRLGARLRPPAGPEAPFAAEFPLGR